MLGKNEAIDKHYLYTPPNGGIPIKRGTWTKHPHYDLPGKGDVEQYRDWR